MEVAKERVPDLKSRFLTPQPLASRLWPLFPVVVPLFHRRRPSASVSVKLVIPCVLFYFFQLYLKQRQRSRSKPPSPPPELPSTVELSPRLNRVLSRSLLSPRASSGPAHVSSRANSIAKQADSPYFVGLNRVSEDPFDELNNPDGFFQLGLAENKGGYRGFYSQNTIPLTPKVVNNIHKRGGTILGTSRGGHDTKKIVDCIQDRGINQALRVRKPYTITKQRERWTEEEHKKFLEALKFLYAAMSGKFAQNVLIAQCCQQNRQFSPQYRRDKFSPNTHNLLPFQRGKLAWPGKSTMQLQILSKLNQGFVYCNGLF